MRKRKVIGGILREVSLSLIPLNDVLRSYAPEHVQNLPTVVHVALIAALSEAMHWPDALLPARMPFGAPTTGDLPPTGVLQGSACHDRRFDL